MAQNLPAPCYQTYAANTLANLSFRQTSLGARGLIHTLELELWVNHKLPSEPAALAKILGLDAAEVTALLPETMAFFCREGEYIFSPRLEDYREHLRVIRIKQSKGGKDGAAITNNKKGRAPKPVDIDSDDVTGNPRVYPQVEARLSSTSQSNTINQNQVHKSVSMKGSYQEPVSSENLEWVTDYSKHKECTADDYARATRG